VKRKELIIIGLLLIAALGYLVLRPSGRIGYSLPQWEPFGSEEVSQVEYTRNGREVTLRKQGEDWFLEGGKTADLARVNRILSNVGKITVLDLVSQRDNYQRFQLDEASAIVLTLTLEEESRTLYLGKASAAGGGTYVRFPGQQGVYTVSGDFKSLLPEDGEELRDKGVLRFDKSRISSVSLIRGEEGIMLNKEEDQWTSDGTESLDSAMIERTLGTLGQLNCLNYLENEPDGTPTLEIILEGDGNNALRVYEETDEGYVATSSDSADSFVMPKYLVEDLLKLFP